MARRNNRKSNPKTTESKVSGKEIESKGKDSEEEKGVDKGRVSSAIPSAANDPEWYARDPRLVVDAASIPFSQPFGGKVDYFKGVSVIPGGKSVGTISTAAIPGICTIQLKPSFGYSGDKTSPVNVCANALYTHVRYINSGRKNYDPADLFMYVGAFGEIYSFLVWCVRLYNYAFMYSQRNFYMGKDLIIANHVNATNVVENLANFRYWINSVINKVSSFCIPGDIYFFKRRVFLYANYYLENPFGNLKDQLYQLAPEGFYAFNLDAVTGAGKLEYQPLFQQTDPLLTISDIQAYFEGILMANITGDEDFGLMSGDVLKAYGDNIMRISQIGEEGGLLPVHDPYVLSQFKNAFGNDGFYRNGVITGPGFNDHNGDAHVFGNLEQSTDGLLIACESLNWNSATVTAAWAAAQHLLTVENPDPGPGDVMEATRLMPFLGLYPDYQGTYFYAFNGGTELPLRILVTRQPGINGSDASGIDLYNFASNPTSLTLAYVRDKNAFKYMPLAYFGAYDSANQNLLVFEQTSNIDNYTLIDNTILKRLHDVAMLSLFYVPGVAKIVS